jgi:chromosome partitioning protein
MNNVIENILLQDADNNIGIEEIRAIEESSYSVIDSLREAVFAPDGEKTLDRLFKITEAAEMVGRSTTAIRQAEKAGRLPNPEVGDSGRRTGYTLPEINHMREVFGTRPWRDPNKDEAVVMAIQNFKGGVGKSTVSAHTAQYLGLAGYRVLVIDCDPQGSTTSLFGINPDYDMEETDTLYPFLVGEEETIRYAIRETYWDQISIIPANLSLYDAEYAIAAKLHGNPEMLDKLRRGIDAVKQDYDVIVIDPPPALGMISLSVLRAANALIVPCRPATIDFGSTAHFFTMLVEGGV